MRDRRLGPTRRRRQRLAFVALLRPRWRCWARRWARGSSHHELLVTSHLLSAGNATTWRSRQLPPPLSTKRGRTGHGETLRRRSAPRARESAGDRPAGKVTVATQGNRQIVSAKLARSERGRRRNNTVLHVFSRVCPRLRRGICLCASVFARVCLVL